MGNQPSLQLTSENGIPRLLPAEHRFRTHASPCSFRGCPALLQHSISQTIPQHRPRTRLNRTFGSPLEITLQQGGTGCRNGSRIPVRNRRHRKQNTERNTTAYIQNWISKLEEDNRLIVHAAGNAQRAVDSILGTAFEMFDENEIQLGVGCATAPYRFEHRLYRTGSAYCAEVLKRL